MATTVFRSLTRVTLGIAVAGLVLGQAGTAFADESTPAPKASSGSWDTAVAVLTDSQGRPTAVTAPSFHYCSNVVGDSITRWQSLDWGMLPVRLVIDGAAEVEQKGGLGAIDPVRPLAWMIDHAVRLGGGIAKGQVITTGSWTGLRYYPPGTRARGEFPGLGSVEAMF